MKKNTSVWIRIICSSIVIILLSGLLITQITGHGFFKIPMAFSIGCNTYYSDSEEYSVGNANITNKTIKNLDVNWIDGTLTVIPVSGDTIRISENNSKTLKEEDKLRYRLKDGALTIQYKESHHGFNFSFGSHKKDKQLTLEIPETMLQNMDNVCFDVTSATVKASDIKCNNLNLDSTSGDLILNNVETESLDTDCTSANVTLNGIVSAVKSDTVSGDINISTKKAPHSIDTDGVSGNVILSFPDNDGFAINFDSVSGDFNSNFTTTHSGDTYTYKNGSASYNMESVSGDITLTKME